MCWRSWGRRKEGVPRVRGQLSQQQCPISNKKHHQKVQISVSRKVPVKSQHLRNLIMVDSKSKLFMSKNQEDFKLPASSQCNNFRIKIHKHTHTAVISASDSIGGNRRGQQQYLEVSTTQTIPDSHSQMMLEPL